MISAIKDEHIKEYIELTKELESLREENRQLEKTVELERQNSEYESMKRNCQLFLKKYYKMVIRKASLCNPLGLLTGLNEQFHYYSLGHIEPSAWSFGATILEKQSYLSGWFAKLFPFLNCSCLDFWKILKRIYCFLFHLLPFFGFFH